MTFPTLYKVTKTGAIQMYKVSSENDVITVTQGQVGGQTQSYYTTCTSKNIGRANETTAAEQAESEAQSKWNKKVKTGYTIDPSGANTKKIPQRVKKYFEQQQNVIFPCFQSPKLNGINGTYRLEGSKLTLWSRGGDEYPPIPHLEEHIRLIMSTLKCTELNGELYIPGTHLQDITSAVKKTRGLSRRLEFHIFEIPDNPSMYKDKIRLMLRASIHESRPVKIVEAGRATTHEEILEYHDHCVSKGYEGSVVRNARAVYKYNEQSSDVFKVKVPIDAEFLIIGHEVDKNKHPVLCCTCGGPDGDQIFKVKPKGTDAERKVILVNINDYIGNWYTVEFETYSKAGVPLKPVGLGLRNCNEKGEPLE